MATVTGYPAVLPIPLREAIFQFYLHSATTITDDTIGPKEEVITELCSVVKAVVTRRKGKNWLQ